MLLPQPKTLYRGLRLVTRVQDDTVFFVTVARAPKDNVTRLGGGHRPVKSFMKWTKGCKPRVPKAPRISERRRRWLAESGQEG
jgi:hypothetical protein